jgi:aryl carrier-like protein
VARPEPGSAAEGLGQHVLLARAVEGAGLRPAAPAGEAAAAEPVTGAGPASYAHAAAARLRAALPAERHQVLVEFVTEQVAGVLRLDPGAVGPRERLMDLGLDSLMAVELRTRLALGLDLPRGLPATLVFDHPTVEAIARHLLPEALGDDRPAADGPADAAADAAPSAIEGLSDDQVMELLVKKLERLERS